MKEKSSFQHSSLGLKETSLKRVYDLEGYPDDIPVKNQPDW